MNISTIPVHWTLSKLNFGGEIGAKIKGPKIGKNGKHPPSFKLNFPKTKFKGPKPKPVQTKLA